MQNIEDTITNYFGIALISFNAMAGIQTRLKQFYSDFQYIYSKLKVCSSLKGKEALKSLKISIILCSRAILSVSK